MSNILLLLYLVSMFFACIHTHAQAHTETGHKDTTYKVNQCTPTRPYSLTFSFSLTLFLSHSQSQYLLTVLVNTLSANFKSVQGKTINNIAPTQTHTHNSNTNTSCFSRSLFFCLSVSLFQLPCWLSQSVSVVSHMPAYLTSVGKVYLLSHPNSVKSVPVPAFVY